VGSFDFIDEGVARTNADPLRLAMFPTLSINFASVSKGITRIGVMKSLAEHSVSLDAKIEPYLYPDWVKGDRHDHFQRPAHA
jgi:CubicO group peptidase (beta-lactamase class C family)